MQFIITTFLLTNLFATCMFIPPTFIGYAIYLYFLKKKNINIFKEKKELLKFLYILLILSLIIIFLLIYLPISGVQRREKALAFAQQRSSVQALLKKYPEAKIEVNASGDKIRYIQQGFLVNNSAVARNLMLNVREKISDNDYLYCYGPDDNNILIQEIFVAETEPDILQKIESNACFSQ